MGLNPRAFNRPIEGKHFSIDGEVIFKVITSLLYTKIIYFDSKIKAPFYLQFEFNIVTYDWTEKVWNDIPTI